MKCRHDQWQAAHNRERGMMTRRTSKAPEAKAAAERPIPEDPLVSGPRPAQALALILPQPPAGSAWRPRGGAAIPSGLAAG
jgi:hypothetical protein